jgi:hypothetical protein
MPRSQKCQLDDRVEKRTISPFISDGQKSTSGSKVNDINPLTFFLSQSCLSQFSQSFELDLLGIPLGTVFWRITKRRLNPVILTREMERR